MRSGVALRAIAVTERSGVEDPGAVRTSWHNETGINYVLDPGLWCSQPRPLASRAFQTMSTMSFGFSARLDRGRELDGRSPCEIRCQESIGAGKKTGIAIKINNAEYIPFDNLVDVIGAVDMKPLGTDGVRYGALPKGTNLVCLPNGRVRLALPVRLEAAGSLGIVASSSAAVLKTSPPKQPDDS